MPVSEHRRRDSNSAYSPHASTRRCRGRWPASLAAVLLAAGRRRLFMPLGTGFLPDIRRGRLRHRLRDAGRTALEETDRSVRRSRRSSRNAGGRGLFTRRTGSELGLFATQQNTGDILVRLKARGAARPFGRRDHQRPARQARGGGAAAPRSSSCSSCRTCWATSRATPTPIEVKIFGDDPDQLAEIADEVQDELEGIPGIVDVVGTERGQPGDDVGGRSPRRPAAWG